MTETLVSETAQRPGEGGFVLIATLWFVALLALVAVIIAGWMSRSLDRHLSAAAADRCAASPKSTR